MRYVTGTESYFENFLYVILRISVETQRKFMSIHPNDAPMRWQQVAGSLARK